MTWRLWDGCRRKRIADPRLALRPLPASTSSSAGGSGELDGDIVLVASNHPDLRATVEAAGLPYHHVPVDAGDKPAAEARLLEVLDGECDLVVLARYMQILSGDFLDRVGVPGDQHPPLVPARVRGRRAVRAGQASAA